MKKLIAGALAALTLGSAMSVGVSAAQADDWHGRGGYYGGRGDYGRGDYDRHDRGHRGYGAGALIGAGILGLAVGAAVAERHPRVYATPAYEGAPTYYYGPAPSYYYGPNYYGYVDGCRTYWRWDAYWRRYVEVERCY